MKLDDYFDHLEKFPYRSIFDGIQNLWEPLARLDAAIVEILAQLPPDVERIDALEGTELQAADAVLRFPDRGLCVRNWMELQRTVWIVPLGLVIGKGTVLEPSAILKGPAVIGQKCEVRQGAYLRGNVLTGDHCVIGHNTEIKNSILMNHTEAGHFNYIGDSIIGSYVNLGAGSRLANLQFRTPREKTEGFIRKIRIETAGDLVDTGMEKLGAVLGDYVELGCNAVICPGVFLGKESWVYPNYTVSKGFYPPQTLLVPADRKIHPRKR